LDGVHQIQLLEQQTRIVDLVNLLGIVNHFFRNINPSQRGESEKKSQTRVRAFDTVKIRERIIKGKKIKETENKVVSLFV